jgi:hypothetical protein
MPEGLALGRGFAFSGSPSLISAAGFGGGVILGPGATAGAWGFISLSDCFSICTPTGCWPFLIAEISSSIVLIEDLKTGGGPAGELGLGGGVTAGGVLGTLGLSEDWYELDKPGFGPC